MYTTKETIKTGKIGNIVRITMTDMFGNVCYKKYATELNETYESYKVLKQIYYGWIPNYGYWSRRLD